MLAEQMRDTPWNEQTSEQRFFTDAFDRDVMQQTIRLVGGAISIQPWFDTVPRRYQPHAKAISERVHNATVGQKGSTRLALAVANELHDALWTELVPIHSGTPTGWPQQAAPGTRRALDLMLDEVDAPGYELELIANATEPAIIRVAVTPHDARIETAIGFYLKPHVAAGVGLFVDGGPVWEVNREIAKPGPFNVAITYNPDRLKLPIRALTADQLDDAAVECDRMLRDGAERDRKPAEYWAQAVIGEQRRRAEAG